MKPKLNVFVALSALLIGLLVLSGCGKKPDAGRSSNADLTGQWNGTLTVNNAKLRLVLHITKAADGSLSASMDSPDQGAKDLPVTSILFNNPALRLEMEGLAATFDGSLNPKGSEISGNWKQGLQPLPLVFRRAEDSKLSAKGSELSYTLSQGAAPDIRGYWKGTLDVGGTKLRLALKVGKAPNGTFSGTLDSLDQGARDIPATAITFKSPNAKLEWKLLSAAFTGTLSADGKNMTGQWEQAGRPLPLTLERADKPVTGDLADADLSFDPTAGSPSLQGYWSGELDAGRATLRLALKIGKSADGSYSGTLDSIDQGAKNIPMTTITFASPAVRLEWKALGARFEGTLNDASTEITGKFNQGPLSNVPLTFGRTNSPVAQK